MEVTAPHDVLIIGGSYAGLSAALALGRSLRRVLVLDAGRPANRQTPHAHNFLTGDGQTPQQLRDVARAQALAYPTVAFAADAVRAAERQDAGFAVETAAGRRYTARRLLLATGVEDVLPAIPGFAECWGRSVLHCPYCHGYEVHGQPLGLLGNGDAGYELVRLLSNWSPRLTLLTNGPAALAPAQRQLLERLNVPVLEAPVVGLEHVAGSLRAVQLADGRRVALTAVFARVPFRQHAPDLAARLGCRLTEAGLVEVSELGQTTAAGVYAAGDNSSPLRAVAVAVANGTKAGADLNRGLIEEDLAAR